MISTTRYVKAIAGEPGVFMVVETSNTTHLDLRQERVGAVAIPQHIADKAEALRGHAFGHVEWPH